MTRCLNKPKILSNTRMMTDQTLRLVFLNGRFGENVTSTSSRRHTPNTINSSASTHVETVVRLTLRDDK